MRSLIGNDKGTLLSRKFFEGFRVEGRKKTRASTRRKMENAMATGLVYRAGLCRSRSGPFEVQCTIGIHGVRGHTVANSLRPRTTPEIRREHTSTTQVPLQFKA